jgi:formate dehydrogenase iron-sulfur subunit
MPRGRNRNSKGLLIDTTRCVGCGACYQACKEKNELPVLTTEVSEEKLADQTYTVVQKRAGRYVRKLCMHCQEPTCVSVCPVGALRKTELGPVAYDEDSCMGCRYCMQACPFDVPKYEWSKVLPRISKCSLCEDRLEAGLATACAGVCPTGATTFGLRADLIEEARSRIRSHPGRYVDHIYGLEEVGGTSVLLISDVTPDLLGYPTNLSNDPLPLLTWQVLEKIPSAVAVGGVVLSGIWWITNRRAEVQRAEGKSGQRGRGV